MSHYISNLKLAEKFPSHVDSAAKYGDTKGSASCTDCDAGYSQPGQAGLNCTACAAGRSTDGKVGFAGLECPACEQHSYCNHDVDCTEDGGGLKPDCQNTKPCGSCDKCTITEYTDGTGAKSPSKCLTLSAVFGLHYPNQCWIIWIILGGVVACIVASLSIYCLIVEGVDNEPVPTDVASDKPMDIDTIENTKLLAFMF